MMIRKLILIGCLLLPVLGYSQRYKPGYIVNLEGDTIRGQLVSQNNAGNYQKAKFLKEDNVQAYGPEELKAFGYDGDKQFVSGVVEGAFAEFLVKGSLSLFKHENAFFLRKGPGGVMQKLEVSQVEAVDEFGRPYIKLDNSWRGVLLLAVNDCISSEGKTRIESLTFGERGITKAVISYNQCIGGDFEDFKSNKAFISLAYGGIVSLAGSRIINDPGERAAVAHVADRYEGLVPSVGAVLQIKSPRVSEGFMFQPELHYSFAQYSGTQSSDDGTLFYLDDTYMTIHALSVPLGAHFAIPSGENAFWLFGGPQFDLRLSRETRWLRDRLFEDEVRTQPEQEAFVLRGFQPGVFAGIGYGFPVGKLSGAVRLAYTYQPTMNDTPLFALNNHNVSFQLVLTTP